MTPARRHTTEKSDKMLSNPPVQKRPPTGDNWKLGREPNDDGFRVMSKVISKRLGARGKATDQLISTNAIALLVRMSGGIMRELIRYVHNAATFAQLLNKMQIDEDIAQRVINQEQQDIAARLTVDLREALRQVMKQGELSGGQREPVEDDLLRSLHLLSYQDNSGNAWFDAHQNVFSLL